MQKSKPIKLGYIFSILFILLTACSNNKEIVASVIPAVISTVTPTVSTPQASAVSTSPIPSVLSDKPLYEVYKGAWIDREYNYKQCMFCHTEIDIDFPQVSDDLTKTDDIDVYLTFYDGIKMIRIVDAVTRVKLNQAGFGEFVINEEQSGFEGKGTIRLQQDQIVVDLTVSTGPEKAKEIFSRQRTFIKDPYQFVTLAEPLELAKRNCGNCNTYIMKLEPGVEWHEDLLSGEYLEVVNAWDQNEEIVRKFIVNTVKGTVREVPLTSEPSNTFWDSMAETTTILQDPSLMINHEAISLDNLKAGLRFANPQIRLYCVDKIMEALTKDNREELAKLVAPLMDDADETVQKAAQFTNALLTRTYDNQNRKSRSDF
ncbi:hypothetical protein EHS13_18745 [Paenibacillus psychroresistens]|uniref:Uncharacterized protein n=1 Tax=Paenibacillus psychroresistens TaxID=1778678 RepID=A0A6B8RK23_9BACL|nr:hypothetical protein [Paenibacillus psychroresistens]QGQ96771.1 hypothetical protein EHS13_18745 [Paenibacillus psychroresistens]